MDLIHALEHCYEAVRGEGVLRWELFEGWAELIWRGEVDRVLSEMAEEQERLGIAPEDCEETNPRKILASVIGYFDNNRLRMNYDCYRIAGLPLTSAHRIVSESGELSREGK